MFNPKYTISNNILNRLTQIAEIASIVKRSILLPEREVFLRRAAIIKMAHSSTSIEGNTLKEYQVAQVVEGSKVTAETSQIKEVKNYLLALRHIDVLANKNKQFTIDDVLKTHKIVTKDLMEKQKQGVWRKSQVYIVNVLANGKEEVAYTPPKAKDVPMLIGNLLEWLENENILHPIIKAGLFHYQFETIHPFTDGNGRTGRLLTLLYLYQSGWDFKKILVLEDFYNQNRKRYYESLQTGVDYKSRGGADLTNWLEYFTEGFLAEAEIVIDQITSLLTITDVKTTRNFLDKEELQIIDFVITLGQITSSDVVDILQIPKRTAQDKLKKLEEINIIKKMGAGPSTYYIIPGVSLS